MLEETFLQPNSGHSCWHVINYQYQYSHEDDYMAKKKIIKECLIESTKSGILRAIDASILCAKMKSSELKKDLELGRRPVKDMENAIKSLDYYTIESQILKL